jgi:hypothetical protein
MRRQQLLLVLALAALTCAMLVGCAGSPRAAGRLGSPGNPLLLSCGQEAVTVPVVPLPRQPGDLVIGPVIIIGGRKLATANPAGYGSHGSYKIPIMVSPGPAVTITIAVRARGQVAIDNPYSPVGGVVAARYRSCSQTPGFFAQGFAFTRGQIRGCVPLDVRTGHDPDVRHVTLSLFAGSCAR